MTGTAQTAEHRDFMLHLYRFGYGSILLEKLNHFHEEIAGTMPNNSIEKYELYMYMGLYLIPLLCDFKKERRKVRRIWRVCCSLLQISSTCSIIFRIHSFLLQPSVVSRRIRMGVMILWKGLSGRTGLRFLRSFICSTRRLTASWAIMSICWPMVRPMGQWGIG